MVKRTNSQSSSAAEPDDDASAGDTQMLKGVMMLFMGGMCIAAGVFLVLICTVGGTKEEPSPPDVITPPPPVANTTTPGHWLWWKALEGYNLASKKVADHYKNKELEEEELKRKFHPPLGADVVISTEPATPKTSGYVTQSEAKKLKKLEKKKAREDKKGAKKEDTVIMGLANDTGLLLGLGDNDQLSDDSSDDSLDDDNKNKNVIELKTKTVKFETI